MAMQNHRFIVLIFFMLFVIARISFFIINEKKIEQYDRYVEYIEGFETLEKQQQFKFSIVQEGEHMVLQNYIRADDIFPHNESITYTTHGTYKDLKLLEELMDTWHAPVSMAVFASGSDFNRTLNRIFYLRECSKYSVLIRYFVTFHICMHEDHVPKFIPNLDYEMRVIANCTAPHWSQLQADNAPSYWQQQQLHYPLNLLRNIARRTALTYFVFPLELIYEPIIDFSRNFLDVVTIVELYQSPKSVYCIPITEKISIIDNTIPQSGSLSDKNGQQPDDKEYLFHQERSQIYLQKTVSNNSFCDGQNYVRVINNKLEPFYDESIPLECTVANLNKPQVTDVLHYDYLILGGTLVKRRGQVEHLQKVDSSKITAENCQLLYKNTAKQWELLYKL